MSPPALIDPPLPRRRQAISEPEEWQARAGRLLDYVELLKPRIAVFVLLATAAGLYLGTGSRPGLDPSLLFHALAGTALLSGAASALNQLLERRLDSKMRRTMDRPLPSGRVHPAEALFLGAALAALGLLELSARVNPLTALLGFLSLSSYLLVYTPLKRLTPLSTLVGGVPGALPPVMGWTAAQNGVGPEAAVLFAVLFLWQVPHFLAIARMHREDYARAGFRVLTVTDPDGSATGRAILFHCAALVPVGLLPAYLGLTGAASLFASAALGLGFLGFGIDAALRPEKGPARRLLFASLVYLPAVLLAYVLDRA